MAVLANLGTKTTSMAIALVLTILLTPGFCADEECGSQCGYGAKCSNNGCVCESGYGGLFTIIRKSSSIIYCVENCQPNTSSCPAKTTCKEMIRGDGMFRCYCSADADTELSDRGQCLDKRQPPKIITPGSPTRSATSKVNPSSTTIPVSRRITSHSLSTTSATSKINLSSTTSPISGKSTNPKFSSPTEISTGTQTSTKEHPVAKNTSGDPEAWKVGVAGGSGGAVLLALLVLIACVSLRKKKKHRHITTPQHLSNKNGKSNSAVRQSGLPYRNVADLPLSERNGTDNPAYSTVVSETQLSDPIQSRNISTPAGAANKDGGTYDISELYSVVNKPTKIDTARNAELEGLYANYQIPAEKCKQRNEAKTSRNEGATKSYTTAQATNLYNTSNQPGAPESGNLNFAEQKGDYDTAYNAKVQTGPPAHLMCDEYDELLI